MVRTAEKADRRLLVSLLTRAFVDDPVFCWMQPDTSRRHGLFTVLVRDVHAAPGASDLATIDGQPVGAAVWDPPGHQMTRWQRTRSLVGFITAMRSQAPYGQALERTFAEYRPTTPHWYLSTIGAVTPGRGIGSALLRHRLDQMRGPAYLESSNIANVPLYERFGFEVTKEFALPMDGPTIWAMTRPAPSTEPG